MSKPVDNSFNPEDLLPTEDEMQGDTGHERRVYTLQDLSPEVIAVAFAKTSRSPLSFDAIAKKADAESSAKFHDKWVVGYGHASVAEHASLHVAFENISNIAVKVIEDNRLASYTEKSTRYQVLEKSRFYRPKNVVDSDLGPLYLKTIEALFDGYHTLFTRVAELMAEKNPKKEGQSDRFYRSQMKARACDVVRYLLPAATYTNVGMTLNARAAEWAITKGLSHPLEEVREIAAELKETASEVTPTLIKYADENPYLVETREAMRDLARAWADGLTPEPAEPVTIVDHDADAEHKLVAALLYEHLELPWAQIIGRVRDMTPAEKARVIDEALKRRGDHDQPLRALEHVYYTFDILMDYGAYRDVQRHRMATQTNQLVTCAHGYDMPPEIAEIGAEDEFRALMDRAADAHARIKARFPDEAQYVVPMAFRKRTLFTWNLRELHHFISLRSGKKGHPSYRRIAQLCWQKLHEVHPLLAEYVRVDMTDTYVSTLGEKVKNESALE